MAQRTLTEVEVKEFRRKYDNASSSLVNAENKTQTIFSEYEKNCELVGILGLKANIPTDTLETIQLCEKAGIKIMMLSGDYEERCVSAGYCSGILQK
jgi:P-type E1-E2 ATPase